MTYNCLYNNLPTPKVITNPVSPLTNTQLSKHTDWKRLQLWAKVKQPLPTSKFIASIYEIYRLYRIKWSFQLHLSTKAWYYHATWTKKYGNKKFFRFYYYLCVHRYCSIWPHLQVSALRLEPVVDETLWVSCEAQHELPLSLQLVNSFNGLMDLRGTSKHVWGIMFNILITQQLVQLHYFGL